MPNDPNEIGALWRKSSARGEYFTGVINGDRIVVFANDKKSSDKAPDFRVLKAIKKEDRPAKTDDEAPW
jgi:uncharacterized protein (DUF736 family)